MENTNKPPPVQVRRPLYIRRSKPEIKSHIPPLSGELSSEKEVEEDENDDDDQFCPQTLPEAQTVTKTAEAFDLEAGFERHLESFGVKEQQPPETQHFISPQYLSREFILKYAESPPEVSFWSRFALFRKLRICKGIIMTPILQKIVPLLWPKPPKGYKRITWLSALGRPLYIDVKEIVDGAAQRLQERFESYVVNGPSSRSPSSSGTSVSLDHITNPAAVHIREGASTSSLVDGTRNSSPRTDISDHGTTLPSNERRYLLLCFSTHKSETFRQIDVTDLPNDQYLFRYIHDAYCEIRNEECWYSKVALLNSLRLPTWMISVLGGLHFYTPKNANFVSFSLLPLWTTPSPVNIKSPSLPPEVEITVHRNWHYHPCPREVEDFQINQTFLLHLFEPGHAFLDDAWLELFPKKLRSKLVYESGKITVAWGIQIVEGLNAIAIAWMLCLIFIISVILAVIYAACTKDVGGAFTLAAWLVATSTLWTVYFQLR
ncbi:uncharacterized protein TRUGW13939_06603 [Talaromyces rugulosus]|uniref:Uncharacterized protein n=1 Tax=Talaromyces rugulosus TaxID=121627 RepID=A0A7H8QZC5_TALRU|nr:uncharacterized protein TRUGW13939_06603 [Talaromyces rugulosus]QKX59469.1 hypothetical protein TRUGW13939_06603 [Talaromyces rugulosus]